MQANQTPSSCPHCCSCHDVGLLLLRLMVAVVGVYHGSQKLFGWFGGPGMGPFEQMLGNMNVPMPHVSAYLAACAEFVGGILMGIGFLTRPAAFVFFFNMMVACLLVHRSAFGAQNKGMEYPLTLAIIGAALMCTGAGVYSVDMCARKKKPATQI